MTFPTKGTSDVYVLGYDIDEKLMGILGIEEALVKLPGFLVWDSKEKAQIYLNWYNSPEDEDLKQRPEQPLSIEIVPFNHLINQCISTGAMLIMNCTVKNECYTLGKPISQSAGKLSIKTMEVSPEIVKKIMDSAKEAFKQAETIIKAPAKDKR